MKSFLLLGVLLTSFCSFAQAEKDACSLNYKSIIHPTGFIFYYEIEKYEQSSSSFKTLKQWYCDEANLEADIKATLEENCTIINIDGLAIKPNSQNAFDITFGCG